MLSADYIVGLIDGEGCFYVNILHPNKKWSRVKPSVEPHFYLKMQEEELPLLEKVKSAFGCGAIYLQKDKRPNHVSCFRYEVNSQRDIQNILIPFFDKHPLQSKKKKNYAIFRQIAMMVREGLHKNERGFKKILRLKSQMNLGARRVREIRSLGGNAK